MDRWFEGKAEPFNLKKGKFQVIKITRVDRFEYLNGKCSNESFYRCISKVLKRTDKCGENCTLFSLPGFNYPECINTETQKCQFQEYTKFFNAETCRSKQFFSVQDYTVEESDVEIHETEDRISFYIRYGEPKYSRGHRGRGNRPAMVVHTENLIIDGFTLLGNVGGQMGMFIGFSFIGAIGWIIRAIKKACHLLRKKVENLND